MANSCLYVSRTASGSITSANNMLFDTTIYNTGGISYNSTSGVITINESGVFHINWWLALQNAINSSSGAIFALISSTGDTLYGDTPLKTSSFSGIGVINVETTPVTVSLKNMGTGNAYMSSTLPVKAMLSITKESTESGSESMLSFLYQQLANVIAQLIVLYPDTVMSVYLSGLYATEGTPVELFSGHDASGAGIFVTLENELNQLQAVPLNAIMAINIGATAVYNPSITYLSPPTPFPIGWDANVILGVYDYLAVGDSAEVHWGIGNAINGIVYKNEYGMLVMTADAEGNNPVFILPTANLIILTEADTGTKSITKKKNSGLIKFE